MFIVSTTRMNGLDQKKTNWYCYQTRTLGKSIFMSVQTFTHYHQHFLLAFGVRPNYFIFHRIFMKNKIKTAKRPPPHTHTHFDTYEIWDPALREVRSTMIFSYIRRLGLFFGVQNFEIHYFLGLSKNEYFLGMEI